MPTITINSDGSVSLDHEGLIDHLLIDGPVIDHSSEEQKMALLKQAFQLAQSLGHSDDEAAAYANGYNLAVMRCYTAFEDSIVIMNEPIITDFADVLDDINTRYVEENYEADSAYYCEVYDAVLAAITAPGVEPDDDRQAQADADARVELAVRIARRDKEGLINASEAADDIITRYFHGAGSLPTKSV